MRIRLTTILSAACGYLVGSGKAQQLWRETWRWMEERQPDSGPHRPGLRAQRRLPLLEQDAEPAEGLAEEAADVDLAGAHQ
jgi:hypothetical protein